VWRRAKTHVRPFQQTIYLVDGKPGKRFFLPPARKQGLPPYTS
jgi:hypothetical protein